MKKYNEIFIDSEVRRSNGHIGIHCIFMHGVIERVVKVSIVTYDGIS